MIRKGLVVEVVLDKKLKIFVFILFNFDSSFFQNIFHLNISLGLDCPVISNILNCFENLKSSGRSEKLVQ